MTLVTVYTRRSFGVERLPFGEEDVKVVVKILTLGNVPMAFQAISISDRAGQGSWLRVVIADESHQVLCA